MPTLKSTIIAGSMLLAGGYTAFAQQTATVTHSYNGLSIPVLTDSADVISIAPITVPRALKMTKVTAQVQIQYPNSGDLNVYLYSPQGTRTKLLEHNCSVANVDTTFDDAASGRWSATCPTEAGRGPFQGQEPLSNFNSDNSSYGIWRLAVENNSSDSRSGWITAVSLTITGTTQVTPVTTPQSVVNSASLTGGGAVAPGELVSIFGINIGPTTSVTAPAGALPTSLGGSSVTINGTPAPIVYASAFRNDIVVPFSVAPGSTVQMAVSYNGQTSSPVTLNVMPTLPGVYTASVGGPGPVRAVNQSGSINSIATPAPKGSIIAVYVSGLGAVNPAITAGTVPPSSPLSLVTAGIAASIGGTPAPVAFAGLAPGLPGWYQVNIMVPQSATSGTQDLLISAAGNASQQGATVVIQ